MGAAIGVDGRPNNTEPDWYQHAVLYQIYPRSFMDSNGDGIGDLRGIISKLPYLAEIGVTGTWLSPIFKSPMVDFGYDVSDFKAIQDEYGTMEDFDDLIKEAKRLNIKIILDFVPNHSSDQCEWFKKSVNREEDFEDFYIWADGKIDKDGKRLPPNNWNSVFYGSAWEWNEMRQQFYLHQFTVAQPDLNYRNPKVVQAMDDVLRFWLDKGVSGFRVDAVNHLFEVPELTDEPLSGKVQDNKSYDYTQHIYSLDLPEVIDMLQHWRALLDHYSATHDGPTRIMMTEAYTNIKLLMDYYETRNGVCGPHFPFNFGFIADVNAGSDARDFVSVIQKWLTYMPRGHTANWVMGNHDNPRVASRFSSELVDVLNMMIMTLPGVAVTYNGEEIGMQDYRDMSWDDTVDPAARNVGPEKYKWVSRDPERTPFQWSGEKNAGFSSARKTWLPVHPDYQKNNLEKQRAAPKSTFKVYKELTELRKLPAVRDGLFRIKVVNRDVFAIKRELKGQETVYTILNIAATEQLVNLSDVFTLPKTQLTVLVATSNSDYEKGDKLKADSLELAPHEGLVCMLKV